MADNYLEKKYEELQARKSKEHRLKQAAWKKRMEAYRKKLEAEREAAKAAEAADLEQKLP
jgi:guanylate kinase